MGPMPTRSILKFGPFEAGPSLGDLCKAGVRISLLEKPPCLREALSDRQCESVTRPDLHQH